MNAMTRRMPCAVDGGITFCDFRGIRIAEIDEYAKNDYGKIYSNMG